MKGKLTPRQRKMVEEYIICRCKAKAAVRAGFASSYAQHAFKQPSVRAYLAERMESINEQEQCIVRRLNACAACTSRRRTNCDGAQGNVVKDAADLIVRQSADIASLAQENAELRDQVYNLTLYLTIAMSIFSDDEDRKCAFMYAMLDQFEGMPGYNPAILEVQHEHTV